jgi:hypothetical protein
MANLMRLLFWSPLLLSTCWSQQLQLLGFDPINVDGSASTASTHLRLKNLDPKNPSGCTLWLQDFQSANTNQNLRVVVTFYDPDTPGPPPAVGRAVGPAVMLKVPPPRRSASKPISPTWSKPANPGDNSIAISRISASSLP